MPTVAQILASRHAVYAWLLVIEGVAPMFTNRPEICGTGEGSWIGTSYGEREVLLGLVMPNELSYGYAWSPTGELEEGGGAFQIVDFDGRAVDLFRYYEPDQDTDNLYVRLAPTDDPAPESVPGPLGTPVSLWDRNIGPERIGPEGQRRWFWCWPSDAPNGFDHPAGTDWPPVRISNRPLDWNRKCAVYMIVRDPISGTWPSWQDQHDGGALQWQGTIRSYGNWHDVQHRDGKARAIDLHVSGPCSWQQGAINLNRPAQWIPISPAVEISEALGNHKVACWMWDSAINNPDPQYGYKSSVWDAQTFASGNTLIGVTTREELCELLNSIAKTMISGDDTGGILAATNSAWAEGAHNWQDDAPDDRKVTIQSGGTLIDIRREQSSEMAQFGLCLHASVWAAMGWDPVAQGFDSLEDEGGVAPVGGEYWGEDPGANKPPTTGYYVGEFTTMGGPEAYKPDNNGSTVSHYAAWPTGTVLFNAGGGDLVQLGVGVLPCEGQLAQPPPEGVLIDGTQCNASGWWVFRGKRFTLAQYQAGEEPTDEIQVALCDWVATDDRLGIEITSDGRSAMRIRRWEDPRRFGIASSKFKGTWASASGTLEAIPIAVLGGQLKEAPGQVNWIVPQLLLSSGTAEIDPVTFATQPGEQHPPDLQPSDKFAGDVEVRDLGLGLPLAAVDYASWRKVASGLPGGRTGAYARSAQVLVGAGQVDQLIREICVARCWVPTWRRKPGDAVPKYGVLDVLDPLTMQDVEVTLTRASIAAAAIEDGWNAAIKVREAGPYDRFVVKADRDPLEPSRTQYEQVTTSLDRNVRSRSGKIVYSITEGGLKNPAPWVGTPQRPIYDWTQQARDRLGDTAGKHWERPAWLYTTIVDASVAGSYWIGTVVRVIDPVVETPQGSRGLDHVGWCSEAKIITSGKMAGAKQVTITLNPEPVLSRKYCGPAARGYTFDPETSELLISEDYFGLQKTNPDHDDTLGFTRPPWASSLGAGMLKIVAWQSENGIDYPSTYKVTADVVNADATTHTLTLTNIVGTFRRDMIKFVLGAKYSEQTAEWALRLYAPVTNAEGYYGLDLKGWRLA